MELNNIYNNIKTEQPSSGKVLFLNIFWGGFILYTLGYLLKENLTLNEKICQIMQLAGLGIIIFSSIFLIKNKIKNNYLRLLILAYFLWLILIIARGFQFNSKFIFYMLLSPDYGILFYFIPIILFFPKGAYFYKKIFDVIVIFGIINLLFFFLARHLLLERSSETKNTIETIAWTLSMPCSFILMNFKYQSKIRILFAATIMLVALLFSIYNARRGLSIILAVMLMISFFLYLFHTRNKVLPIYLTILFICLSLLYAISIYNINNVKLLNFIAERGEVDTRTGVEIYFYNDMGTKDWIVGRGINGTYYCPGIDTDTDNRTLIETGFLQIILKGGLIRLGILSLIMIPAIFLGLFCSKNLLSKAAACWILLFIFSSYPSTAESFNLVYLLVWISVDICYNKRIIRLSDNEIMGFLRFEKVIKVSSF